MQTAGLRFLASAIDAGDLETYLDFNLTPDHFTGMDLQVFSYIDTFAKEYGKLPTVDTIREGTGHNLGTQPEPTKFYYDELKRQYTHASIVKAYQDVRGALSDDPHKAFSILEDFVLAHSTDLRRSQIVGLDKSFDIIHDYYIKKRLAGDDFGIAMGWPYLDNMTQGLQGGDVVSIIGRPASGKAQPLSSLVLLSDGTWKAMGSLRMGESLASVDGGESKIIGLYPQGKKKVYRITFSDGREVRCSSDHLWQIHMRDWGDEGRVVSTDKLRDMLKAKRNRGRLWVPLVSGDFGKERAFSIDPWLFGFLLGDGCFRSTGLMFSTADQDIVDRVRSLLPEGYYVDHRGNYDYAITSRVRGRNNPIVDVLRDFRLWGEYSHTKFIPKAYLSGSYSQRLALLQGLMDSDGWVEAGVSSCFCSASLKLAEGVQTLARSLGAVCNLRVKPNSKGYKTSYTMTICHRDTKSLFSLDRKVGAVTQRGGTKRLTIQSVVPDGEEECQCINVSHDSSLYVTDGYTVTHNTFLIINAALEAYRRKKRVLVVSMEMKPDLIIHRTSSIISSVPLSSIRAAELSSLQRDKLFGSLRELKDNDKSMWILDGSMSATVDDVYLWAKRLQPDIIFIDGAYLMRHKNNRLDRWSRMAETAEQVKNILATKLNIPVVCSYQFSKESAKKGKVAQGLEDVYGSDAIAQVSSLVLGLLQPETIETVLRREIKILKGRHGEIGTFTINWDFNRMDFSEVAPADIEEDLHYT